MFEQVTSLSLKDFERLVNAGVFNASKMNDAVWKFRNFEEPSLSYSSVKSSLTTVGGWNIRRDENFASLIEKGILKVDDSLYSMDDKWPSTCLVTEDYGLLVEGLRYESPNLAAQAVTSGDQIDGWGFWAIKSKSGYVTLKELLASN